VGWTWFRSPTAEDPGSGNLCYNAVDLPVVRGGADATAVRGPAGALTFAVLLEQAAALAGALRGLGAGPGERVGVRLADPVDELLALLAAGRIGATAVALPDEERLAGHRPDLVVTDVALDWAAHRPRAALLKGVPPRDPALELDWDVALRAGRTDPAPCASVPGHEVAYVLDQPVLLREVAEDTSVAGVLLGRLSSAEVIDLVDSPGWSNRAT
jgi:non-ribosomal peptide synthetase component F